MLQAGRARRRTRASTHPPRRAPRAAIFVAHGAFNFVTQFVHAWSPAFYDEFLDLRPEHATLPLMAPPLVDLAVKVFGAAPLGRWMRARGYSTLGCRRAFSTAGFVGTAAALLPWAVPACARAGGAPLAAGAFSLALGATALHPLGFKANYLDVVSPASAGLACRAWATRSRPPPRGRRRRWQARCSRGMRRAPRTAGRALRGGRQPGRGGGPRCSRRSRPLRVRSPP
jgi:hypothetical protein